MNDRPNPVWHKLTRQQQDLYVKLLWEDNYTHEAIAAFLGTKKSSVVGRQQRHPDIDASRRTKKPERVVNPERFWDLLELHTMAKFEKENGVVAVAPVSPSYKPQRQATCEWPVVAQNGRVHPCDKPVDGDGKLCEEHKALAKKGDF